MCGCRRRIQSYRGGEMKPSGDSSVLQIVQRRFGNFMVFLRVPGRRIFFQKFVQERQCMTDAFWNQLSVRVREGY